MLWAHDTKHIPVVNIQVKDFIQTETGQYYWETIGTTSTM